MEEKHNPIEILDADFYRTGSTQPPKSRSGMLACLMVALILVAGTLNLLSLMDLHLTRLIQYANRDKTSVLVQLGAEKNPTTPAPGAASREEPELGIMAEAVEPYHQQLYDLPAGVLVTRVEPSQRGHRMGMQPGDILLTVNDKPVHRPEDITDAVRAVAPGEKIRMDLHRRDRRITVEMMRE